MPIVPRLVTLRSCWRTRWRGIAHAAPYIPANGSQVVERLPARTDPAQRELARLRAELAANPTDLALASSLAQALHRTWPRIEGDPRYLGYAQAALAPWWNQPQPPDDVLVLRATLRQSTHQFAAALADLDAVVAARQRQRAGLADARHRADRSPATSPPRAPAACACIRARRRWWCRPACSSVGSVSGKARASYDRAAPGARAESPAPTRAYAIWVATLLAEMAARLGDDRDAEALLPRSAGATTMPTATCWPPTPTSCSTKAARRKWSACWTTRPAPTRCCCAMRWP